MAYDLFIGDRTFSSWSLRGWLMFAAFDIPVAVHMVGLYSGTMGADLAPLAPARLVPVMRTPEGHVVGDSLAMAETLHERHPEVGLYPGDPAARALCRWMVAEMHSGFSALRGDCPMMLAHAWQGFEPSDAVAADLARLDVLWRTARDRHGDGGPWLFGRYTLADVFFAPVTARIATYGLPVSDMARAYVQAHLAEPLFQSWRSDGLEVGHDPMPHRMDLPEAPWPGPA